MKKYYKVLGQYTWRKILYVSYLNIGIFLRIPILPLSVDKYGVWFWWKGDEICRRWFWRKGKKYLSVLCGREFNYLCEIDQFWREFSLAIKDKTL